eukprot:969246_1
MAEVKSIVVLSTPVVVVCLGFLDIKECFALKCVSKWMKAAFDQAISKVTFIDGASLQGGSFDSQSLHRTYFFIKAGLFRNLEVFKAKSITLEDEFIAMLQHCPKLSSFITRIGTLELSEDVDEVLWEVETPHTSLTSLNSIWWSEGPIMERIARLTPNLKSLGLRFNHHPDVIRPAEQSYIRSTLSLWNSLETLEITVQDLDADDAYISPETLRQIFLSLPNLKRFASEDLCQVEHIVVMKDNFPNHLVSLGLTFHDDLFNEEVHCPQLFEHFQKLEELSINNTLPFVLLKYSETLGKYIFSNLRKLDLDWIDTRADHLLECLVLSSFPLLTTLVVSVFGDVVPYFPTDWWNRIPNLTELTIIDASPAILVDFLVKDDYLNPTFPKLTSLKILTRDARLQEFMGLNLDISKIIAVVSQLQNFEIMDNIYDTSQFFIKPASAWPDLPYKPFSRLKHMKVNREVVSVQEICNQFYGHAATTGEN